MLVSDLRPLLYLVRLALRAVPHRMAENEWAEAAFEEQFD
jgi:hypothetical protein